MATFAITDGALVLSDLEIEGKPKVVKGIHHTTWKSVKKDVLTGVDQLTVSWFTGILVLPYGERVKYVHVGYGSTYSNYILLEINNGKLMGKRTYDNKQYEQFKEKQYQAFKKTEKYKKLIEKLKNENRSPQFIDSFLRSFVVEYTSKFLVEDGSK